MEIEISEKRDNKILNRTEVFFLLKYKGEGKETGASPSREAARSVLIKELRCGSNLLVIDWMKQEFGKRETVGYAKVYETEDRLKAIEHEHILERNFGAAESEKGE